MYLEWEPSLLTQFERAVAFVLFFSAAANLLFFLKPRLWPQVIQISPEQKKLLGIADDGE